MCIRDRGSTAGATGVSIAGTTGSTAGVTGVSIAGAIGSTAGATGVGRHGGHLPALHQRLRAALLRHDTQLYGSQRAGIYDRAD